MSVPREKPRRRPFLMELALASALAWAALHWAFGAPDARPVEANLPREPAATGSIRPAAAPRPASSPSDDAPGRGAVHGLLDAFAILLRR